MKVKIGFVGMLVIFVWGSTYENGSLQWLYLQFMWNAPSLLIVILPPIVVAWMSTSSTAAKICWGMLFWKASERSKNDLEDAIRYAQIFRQVTFYAAWLGTFIGVVLITQFSDPNELDSLGPKLSVMSICLLYGFLMAPICILVEKRIESDLIELNRNS